jgi:hypothetical protein
MKPHVFDLLARAARISDRIAILQARHNVSPIRLLRLKALKLAISERLHRAGAHLAAPRSDRRLAYARAR